MPAPAPAARPEVKPPSEAKLAEAKAPSEPKTLAAAKPPAEPRPAAETKPAAQTKPAPEAKPLAQAKPPEPKPLEPKPLAETKPAEAKPLAEPKPSEAKPPAEAKTVAELKPPAGAKPAEPSPLAPPSEPADEPAGAKLAEQMARPAPAPEPAAKPAPSPAKPKQAAAPKTEQPGALPLDPMSLAAMGVALVVLVLLVIFLMRRRRLPNDLDVTALAEDDEPGSITEGLDFGAGERASQAEPVHRGPATPAAARAELFSSDTDQDLFEKPEKGEKMSQDSLDLPIARGQRPVGAPAAASPGVGEGDIGRLVRELERRVAQLETRLDEANDARERLERQVAAQSEELRVQRAAIARTQRALRGMNRGEEEQATEPALRDPKGPLGGN
jgi:hypothetical protein